MGNESLIERGALDPPTVRLSEIILRLPTTTLRYRRIKPRTARDSVKKRSSQPAPPLLHYRNSPLTPRTPICTPAGLTPFCPSDHFSLEMNDNVNSRQALQTWRIPITASNPWNDTGIDLSAGGVYDFIATGEWKDASIPSDADGYLSTPILKLFETFRRIPGARYFKLIGTIGKSTRESILIGITLNGFAPAKSGWGAYWGAGS